MDKDRIFQTVLQRDSESRFEPKAGLADKSNYSRHIFIDRDGSVSEVVRLNVWNDRQREDILGFHFSQQYAQIHYSEQPDQPQFYVVGRDNPWDFEYVMHDGTTFFLEVCRVADRDLLRAMKAENDVSQLLLKDELASFEIKKIERHFPGTLPKELVEAGKSNKKGKFRFNNNEGAPKLFMRPPMNPRVDLKLELEIALTKKAKKNHLGKERTIVVLDNITTHSNPEDFFEAFESLGNFLDNLPFKSVWLYTGYYSDDNGYNCEFSMIPIKPSSEEVDYFSRNALLTEART
jgi:hypothetical protein